MAALAGLLRALNTRKRGWVDYSRAVVQCLLISIVCILLLLHFA